MKNFRELGDTVTLTAPTDGVVSGNLVVVGNLAGVAAYDAAEGEEVEVMLVGVFELPKLAGTAINTGAAVWWDTEDDEVKAASAAGLFPIGVAVAAAGSNAATVLVRLSGVPVVAVAGG